MPEVPPTRGASAPRSGRGDPLEPVPIEADADALAPAEEPRLPAAPLRELARAFQANAEALRGLHAMQADVSRAMQRADRSEMVLQSTQALNETFRSLALIQRELLTRLEAAPKGPGRILPFMMLGLLAVVLGGFWLMLEVIDRRVAAQPDLRLLAAETSDRTLASIERGRVEGRGEAEREVERLRTLLDEGDRRQREAEERLAAERDALDAAKRNLEALQVERESLSRHAADAQTEALKGRALEAEIRDALGRLAVMEPQSKRLHDDLEAERAENARLRKKLASYDMNLPVDDEPTARDASGKPPATPEPRREEGSRDARQIAMVRSRVNSLLEASGRGRPEYWQVTRIDALSEDHLHGVIALRYDAQGRLLDGYESRTLSIAVDRTRRIVTFEFRDGVRVVGEERTPFPRGWVEATVAEGDISDLWRQSGLVMVRTR